MIYRKIQATHTYDCQVFELCFFTKNVETTLVMDTCNNPLSRLVLGVKHCSLFRHSKTKQGDTS